MLNIKKQFKNNKKIIKKVGKKIKLSRKECYKNYKNRKTYNFLKNKAII
jgi:hypothetical protein